MFISYAQNLEDVILNRVFRDKAVGTYVDVGASHPVVDSVTHAFYERGWSGINIEPLPERIAELAYARPRDLNLRLAAAEASGRAVFHAFPRWHGLSTLDPAIAADMTRWGDAAHAVEVELRRLDDVIAEAGLGAIDFLKIDVEGAEARVLAGLDLARHRPTVILVEATYPTTAEPSHEAWEPGLIAAGYAHVLFDGLNRFYLAAEAAHLEPHFRLPPNVFDGYRRAGASSSPLADADHPEHGFARHLAEAWLGNLALVDDAALVRLLGFGLPAHALDGPLTAEALDEIRRRVFGPAATPEDGAGLLARQPRPTVAGALAALVGSERFRRLRSRLGR